MIDRKDVVDVAILKEEVHESTKTKQAEQKNCTKVFTIILGQCSKDTKAVFELQDDWGGLNSKHNVVKFLNEIDSPLQNQVRNDCRARFTAYESVRVLFKVYQARHEENSEYHKLFREVTEVLAHVSVTFRATFRSIGDDILKTYYERNSSHRYRLTNGQRQV